MKYGSLGKEYEAGDAIFRQGDLGDCMFVIQTGSAEVLVREGDRDTRVDVMRAGEVFGEMAILQKRVRSATVRALERTRVLTIDKRTFLKRVHEDPSLAFLVLQSMSNRVRKLDQELAVLKSKKSEKVLQ